MSESEFLWGADEIASFIGRTKSFVYHKQNELPIRKFGKQMVASRTELRNFLNSHTADSDRNSITSGD